jgi:prolyl 4-hydroxylase
MSPTDLRYYLRVYDDELEPATCARLIDSFTALARFHEPNGRGQRAGLEDSDWTELNVTRFSDAGFLQHFHQRIDRRLEAYNATIGLEIAVPRAPAIADLILKRYRPAADEQFQLHFDSIGALANRYLVFLWYLNDVAAGGETVFPTLDLAISPRAGRLLVFPPYWMYQHAGLPPESGEKYILSTYLLF